MSFIKYQHLKKLGLILTSSSIGWYKLSYTKQIDIQETNIIKLKKKNYYHKIHFQSRENMKRFLKWPWQKHTIHIQNLDWEIFDQILKILVVILNGNVHLTLCSCVKKIVTSEISKWTYHFFCIYLRKN